MKQTKEDKGITLIALIVSIIILLILSGISISIITNAGIIEKTKEAKNATQIAKKQEEKDLAQLEANGKTKETEYNGVKIPSECVPISGNKESTVIIDTNGNEWVWVEVPKKYTENCKTDEEIERTLKEYALPYSQEAISDNKNSYSDDWYAVEDNKIISRENTDLTIEQKNLTNGCGLTYEEYYSLKHKMLNSIKENSGFWIGRFEAGDATATEKNIARPVKKESDGKVVIKSSQIPYNYIACEKAEQLAKSLSFNNSICSIPFGIQWDLVCKYLEGKDGLTINEINSDSRKIGNYANSSIKLNRGKYNIFPKVDNGVWKNSKENENNYVINSETNSDTKYNQLLTTGASENANTMNIYDLAGNLYEYTLEKTPSDDIKKAFVVRGGEYSGSGDWGSMSKRFYNSYGNIADYVGFRVTMF